MERRIYTPSSGLSSWRDRLADPETQWVRTEPRLRDGCLLGGWGPAGVRSASAALRRSSSKARSCAAPASSRPSRSIASLCLAARAPLKQMCGPSCGFLRRCSHWQLRAKPVRVSLRRLASGFEMRRQANRTGSSSCRSGFVYPAHRITRSAINSSTWILSHRP